nr:MAG TPA: hypothetical protein [Caudoviricetes sp.]
MSRLGIGGTCDLPIWVASPGKTSLSVPSLRVWTLGKTEFAQYPPPSDTGYAVGLRFTRLTSVRLYPPFILPFRNCRLSGSRN